MQKPVKVLRTFEVKKSCPEEYYINYNYLNLSLRLRVVLIKIVLT